MIISLLAAFVLGSFQDTTQVLSAATVYGDSRHQELMHLTLGSVEVGRNYIENNFSGSLMQRLTRGSLYRKSLQSSAIIAASASVGSLIVSLFHIS